MLQIFVQRLQCAVTPQQWRAGGSPYVCCCGDGSLVNDLWRDVLRRAVLAVVLLGRLQFDGVPEVTYADQVAARTRHQDVLWLEGNKSVGLCNKGFNEILVWSAPSGQDGRCSFGAGIEGPPEPAEHSSGSAEEHTGRNVTAVLHNASAVRLSRSRQTSSSMTVVFLAILSSNSS